MKISEVYGRFGNNIIQLINATTKSKQLSGSLDCSVLKSTQVNEIIDLDKLSSSLSSPLSSSLSVNVIEDLFWNEDLSFEEHRKVAQKYIKPYLRQEFRNLKPINDLVIHIRTGDIFIDTAHESYIQPPLKFYETVLNNDQVILLYDSNRIEQGSNPVIKELLKKKNVIKGPDNFKDVVKLILSAKKIVLSNSTFVPSILTLSNNIEEIYYLALDKQAYDYRFENFILENQRFFPMKMNKITFHPFILDSPYITNWYNSEEQLEKMISYTGNIIAL